MTNALKPEKLEDIRFTWGEIETGIERGDGVGTPSHHHVGLLLDHIDALTARVEELEACIWDCIEYFDNRADADCDQDGYIPNEEMRLQMACEELVKKKPCAAELKSAPFTEEDVNLIADLTQHYTYSGNPDRYQQEAETFARAVLQSLQDRGRLR